jgi:membrane protein
MYNDCVPTLGQDASQTGAELPMLGQLKDKIDRLVWGDHLENLGPFGRALATVLRYLYAMLRDVFSNDLVLRAMSLVYTTLLSIVPLLAVSFALAKGFGMVERLEEMFKRGFTQLGPDGAEIAQRMLDMAKNINGKAIGAIGVVVFLWTAISTVQKVEASFNYVWYVSKPRNWARRFSEYMVVLLVGPIIMTTAFSMIASLNSNQLVGYLETLPGFAAFFLVVGKLLPYALIVGMFTFLYIFMPNTKVHVKSALVGGLAGGIMWATVSVIFTTFVATSFRTFAVYASFAVGIIALIWLYLNWLVLLLGAQLAFYYQNPAYLRIGRQEPRLSNGMRERLALNIMMLVGQAFRSGDKGISATEIGSQLSIPAIALTPIGTALEDAGLLVSTESEELVPGREMSRIPLSEILAVVRSEGGTGSHSDPTWSSTITDLGVKLDSAMDGVVQKETLSDLVDAVEKS